MKPKCLDLFCCAGGAAHGYMQAGFDVTGVDIRPQPRYPARFIQADALDYLAQYGWQYDFIHASPPCQSWSVASRLAGDNRKQYPQLIPHVRFILSALGVPYVIENVAGARAALRNPIMLCGSQFWLKVYRHRLFESNVYLFQPPHQPHHDQTPPAGRGASPKGFISITGGGIIGVTAAERRDAMGIDFPITNAELTEAIPPAYTRYIGEQIMAFLSNRQGSLGGSVVANFARGEALA